MTILTMTDLIYLCEDYGFNTQFEIVLIREYEGQTTLSYQTYNDEEYVAVIDGDDPRGFCYGLGDFISNYYWEVNDEDEQEFYDALNDLHKAI